MKKVVYSLAVLFSVALVSCGGNKAAEAVDTDSVVAEVVEDTMVVANDSDTAVVVEEAAAVEAAPADSAK